MALTVGQLRVQLEARTAAFRRDLNRAQTQVKTFATRSRAALAGLGRAFSGLRANLGTLAAGAGILAGVGAALITATRAAAGSVDEIAKAARQANVTATEFQRLTFAAEEAGVETRGFANSLLLFNRNIGEALTGIGPGAEAFEALGINIKNADGSLKDIQTLFGETADQLSTVQSGAQRAQISFDLFGRQGAKLAPLLALGSDAIREVGDQAERLGLIFDETIIANSEAVNDAFGRLARVIDVQVKSALIDLAPEMLELAAVILPQLISAVRVIAGFFGILKIALAGLQTAVVALVTPLVVIKDTFQDLFQLLTNSGGVVVNLLKGNFREAAAEARTLGATFADQVAGNIEEGANTIAAAGEVTTDAVDEFQKGDEALAKLGARFETVARGASATAAALRDGSIAAAAAAENANRLSDSDVTTDPNALAAANELQRAQQQGATALLRLEQQRAQAAAALQGPGAAQVFALEQQIVALREATLTDEDRVRANSLINTLIGEQNTLIENQTRAAGQIPFLTEQVNGLIANLTTLDPEAAAGFAEELQTRVAEAVGPEGKEEALIGLATEVGDALDDELKERELPGLGSSVATGVTDGFNSILEGGGVDGFLGGFSSALQASTENALDEAFTSAVDGLGGLLDGALGDIGGGALVGAVAGVAGSLIAAGLQEDNVQSAAANVSSAVTSSQQVRGIAAGPTSIGIAQVQRGIQEAFVEPTRLLRLIARSNELIAANSGSGGTAGVSLSDNPDEILATEGPSFI